MKRVSILSLVLVLALSLVGCTNGELELYNAFQKSLDISSAESTTELSFAISADGLSKKEQGRFDLVKDSLKDSKLTIGQKVAQNKDKTVSKAQIDLGVDYGGMKIDTQAWVDSDISNGNSKLLEIIKIPAIAKGNLGPENQNKDYLVYDVKKLLKEEGGENLGNMLKISKDMESKINELLAGNIKNYDLGFKIVESKGKRIVNDEILSIYEVKLSDQSFKKVIREAVNSSLDSKDTIEFIKDYVKLVDSMVKLEAEEEVNLVEEIDSLEASLPEFKKEFNEFMDSIADVKIIGDKGIAIEYGVDKNGYIRYESGVVNVNIEPDKITSLLVPVELQEESEVSSSGKISLGINFKTNIKSINKKLKIDIPEVNSENSIDYMDLLNQFEQSLEFPIE